MKISYLFLNYLIFLRSVVGIPVAEGATGYMDFPVTEGGALFLSPVEQEIVSEINLLRSDPAGYAGKYLEPLTGCYRGSMLYIPGQSPVRTREGLVALRDAIRCLKISAPAPPLHPSLNLTLASRDLRNDQARYGGTGHTGTDGSSAQARIRKYGRINKAIGENIFYGEEDPKLIILHLVIDDGTLSRGHRLNLLDKDYRMIGVAMGTHPEWKYFCVMNFADDLK